MTKNELTRAERVLGLIVAAVIGLGAVAAVSATTEVNEEAECSIFCWCRAEVGKKYLVCGMRD